VGREKKLDGRCLITRIQATGKSLAVHEEGRETKNLEKAIARNRKGQKQGLPIVYKQQGHYLLLREISCILEREYRKSQGFESMHKKG